MLTIPIRIKNTEHLSKDQVDQLVDELRNKLSDAVFDSLQAAKTPDSDSGGVRWSIQTWDLGQ
jgi:hypothetical protein